MPGAARPMRARARLGPRSRHLQIAVRQLAVRQLAVRVSALQGQDPSPVPSPVPGPVRCGAGNQGQHRDLLHRQSKFRQHGPHRAGNTVLSKDDEARKSGAQVLEGRTVAAENVMGCPVFQSNQEHGKDWEARLRGGGQPVAPLRQLVQIVAVGVTRRWIFRRICRRAGRRFWRRVCRSIGG